METQLPVLGTNGYPLQDAAVYGPIHSRRYGNSLGINPLPVSYKFCDFDCVYCQYGWTPRTKQLGAKTGEKLKPLADLVREIENAFLKFKNEGISVNVITIAGNGEPTLYPEFLKLTNELLRLRNEYFPRVKIGILSDSSQCHRLDIKQALELLDERCMKLDGGDPETIEKINKPAGRFDLKRTVEALKNLKDVTIQSLFLEGSHSNTSPEQIEAWVRTIDYIKPSRVQVYTIDRPPADSAAKAVSELKLKQIAQMCRLRTGVATEVFD